MRYRTLAYVAFAMSGVMAAMPAVAQPERPFSLSTLKAVQARGQVVLVDVYAPWCPVCRAQAPTIAALTTNPAFKKLQVLKLDYDHQDAEKKALAVSKQSTLIAYRGGREVGRLLGVTDPGQIRKFAATALQ